MAWVLEAAALARRRTRLCAVRYAWPCIGEIVIIVEWINEMKCTGSGQRIRRNEGYIRMGGKIIMNCEEAVWAQHE
jgi:hypothetical protein